MADVAEEGPVASAERWLSTNGVLHFDPLQESHLTRFHAINFNIFALGLITLRNDRRDGTASLGNQSNPDKQSNDFLNVPHYDRGVPFCMCLLWRVD